MLCSKLLPPCWCFVWVVQKSDHFVRECSCQHWALGTSLSRGRVLAMPIMTLFTWLVPQMAATNQLKISPTKDGEEALPAAKPTQRMPSWIRSFPTTGFTTLSDPDAFHRLVPLLCSTRSRSRRLRRGSLSTFFWAACLEQQLVAHLKSAPESCSSSNCYT